MLDVVVLNYNDAEQTLNYVAEINSYTSLDHIIVVDNCSTDDSFTRLSSIHNGQRVFVIRTEKNGGYGYGNNFGVKYAIDNFSSRYVAISNPDVHFTENVIKECCEFLRANKQYAAVAPRMKDKDGAYMHCAWNIVPWYRYVSHQLILLGKLTRKKDGLPRYPDNNKYSECDCIAGSLFVVDVECFMQVGMFDENIFLYCEETSLGIKFKNYHYKEAVLNDSFFIHDHSVSISKSLNTEFKRKRAGWKSRMYLLKQYYHLNSYQMLICAVAEYVSIVEAVIIRCFVHTK